MFRSFVSRSVQAVLHRQSLTIQRSPVLADHSFYLKYFTQRAIEDRLFCNVGAGRWRHPFWINIDHASDWYSSFADYIDIDHDLTQRKPIPIPDASAYLFYTSHTIEHIRDEDAAFLFQDIFRALRPGGVVRITCPNAELYYRALMTGLGELRTLCCLDDKVDYSDQQLFLSGIASQLSNIYEQSDATKLSDEEVDEILARSDMEVAMDEIISRCKTDLMGKFAGHHINWWTTNKLRSMLTQAGFDPVVPSAYLQSIVTVMQDARYFDQTHPNISLYMDAVRPAD